MFGAFKPSAPLSGGLLWKIPWRLSRPQKLRQRQRLRRVDNVVSILDVALKREMTATRIPQLSTPLSSTPIEGSAAAEGLPQIAENQRMLARAATKDVAERRHGLGPKKGDYVPDTNPVGIRVAGKQLLRDVVAEHGTTKLIERWKAEMPTEQEMWPKDKYTMFDKKVRGYRKGIHKLPKWTRMSQRLNPPGF